MCNNATIMGPNSTDSWLHFKCQHQHTGFALPTPAVPPPPGWPVSMLEKLGLSDLLPKWPQEVLNLADTVGNLTAR
jgi:hypothetical protein